MAQSWYEQTVNKTNELEREKKKITSQTYRFCSKMVRTERRQLRGETRTYTPVRRLAGSNRGFRSSAVASNNHYATCESV